MLRTDLILPIFFLLISFATLPFMFPTAFAETENLIVAARTYEQIAIYLDQGDELDFSIFVQGGSNDDINMIVSVPGNDPIEGIVTIQHSDSFTATASGNYVFTFDNTISLASNKSVTFSYEITKNTYFVYVDEIPDYAKKYAGNAVYDTTEYWEKIFPKKNFFVADSQSEANIMIQWVRDFTGVQHVGFQYVKLVEVGLGDSYCLNQWNPFSAQHITEIMTHEIGHSIGLLHSDDKNSIMYPTLSQTEYGQVEISSPVGASQVWFIPFCMSSEPSTFQYSIETSDPKFGFDVYVVPDIEDFNDLKDGKPFVFFNSEDCFGEGFLSFGGTCSGPISGSGLIIANNDRLSGSVSTISVKYSELSYDRNPAPYGTKFPTVEPVPKQTPTLERVPMQTPTKEDKVKERCGSGTILKDGVCVLDKCGAGTVLKNGVCVLDSSKSNGGGCLIATATFGTELAPQVQQLRELRDSTLLQTHSGLSFMSGFNQIYYSFSPTIADWERENPVFKETVKLSITPLLTSLSILNYVTIDSDAEMLGYGIGIIVLNIGMYFVVPVILISKLRHKLV